MQRVAHPRGRANATQAKAIDGLERDALSRSRLCGRNQRLDPARLASLGTTQLYMRARIGGGRKIMIEAHHPVHLGAGKVERVSYHTLRRIVYAAELRLNRVKYRYKRPLAFAMGSDNLR